MKLDNGEVKSQRNDIEKELEKFYSDMYTSRVEVTEGVEERRSFEFFIDSVDIPKLSDEDQQLLEKDLTLEELKEAVSSFSDNKTPGEDGFTKEFYETFFDLIWIDLNFYFHGYGGLSFLLKCNYNVGVLNRDLPLFYRELLQYFQDLKIITNVYPNGEFILWNNKSITVDNSTLFWRSWFEHGVAFVHDVLNADGRFLSFDKFKNNFNIKTNYLYYFQLIAAIPPDLKRRATQNIVPSHDFLSTTITFPNEISINLAEMRCKNYYNLFYGNCFIDPSGIRNWQKKFPEDFVTWKEKFCNIYRLTRDNRLRQFSFRFLRRIIVTKKELNRFHI